MKNPIVAGASVGGGVAISLITGLLESTPAGLVGATRYGYPLSWLFRLVVAPQYPPWRVDGVNLLLDLLFWIAVVGVILLAARYATTRRRSAVSAKAPAAY